MSWLHHDLRHAVRALRRRPGYSSLAILTLALGLGVNTIAFSALNALVFKPFRFPDAHEIGWLFVGTAADPLSDTSLPVFERIAAGAGTLEHVAAEGRVPLAWSNAGVTMEIWSLAVSPDYFSIVPAAPRLGRLIGRGDGDRGDVPVVVSERFWRRHLGAASDLTGLSLTVNQQRAAVVGVMPDGFQGPGGVFEPDLWMPLAARQTLGLPARYDDESARWLSLVARPRAGAPRQAIEQEVLALVRSVSGEPTDPRRAPRVSYERLVDRHPEVRQIARAGLIALSLVVLVLLIACFNVAGLVLARSAERRREFSVRAAIGASRWRLARQMLTEGLVLASLAGAASLVIARWSATLLGVFSLPSPIPQRLHFVMDWRVLAFAAAATLIATIVPAVAPLMQMLRTDLARWLGTFGTSGAGGFQQRRTRRAFVFVQVAGSTFLLAVALVMARHFIREANVDPGFDAEHLAVMQIDPTQYGYAPDAALGISSRIVERAAALPGVRASGMADRVSFYVGFPSVRQIAIDGRDCAGGGCTRAGRYLVDAGYFQAMGMPALSGTTFQTGGAGERDLAVISQTAASTLWPGERPIGRSFRVSPEAQWLRVIGVVGDVTHRGPSEAPMPYYYQPIAAQPSGQVTILVRAAGDPAALLLPLRQIAHEIDPRVPVQSVETMEERLAMPLWQSRTTAGFAGACGAVAVTLSAIGLFGVMYFAVNQRRREFGVRLAIGARGSDVEGQVVLEALRLAAPGIVLGALVAVLVGFWLQSITRGLSASDPAPYALAALGQAALAMAASWSPARRASRSNPLEVLRADN